MLKAAGSPGEAAVLRAELAQARSSWGYTLCMTCAFLVDQRSHADKEAQRAATSQIHLLRHPDTAVPHASLPSLPSSRDLLSEHLTCLL